MSRILSRWVVLQEYELGGSPVDDETVEQWLVAAREAYLDRCARLRWTDLRYRAVGVPSGSSLGHPHSVVVTATAAEVRPTSFTISVRLRPIDGDKEVPLNAAWVVSLPGELGTEVRDELIALEHAAQHFN